MSTTRQIWLVRIPTHDRRWLLHPPHLLERIASALMLKRIDARVIDANLRPLDAVQLADAATGDLAVVFRADPAERKAVGQWLKTLRASSKDLPLAVVGDCGDPDLFLQAGANLVLTGEADGAVEQLLSFTAKQRAHVVADPIADPAQWPLPAREHLPPEVYYDRTVPAAHPPVAVVEAARENPTRRREVDAVFGELDMLAVSSGVGSVVLVDADIGRDRAWLNELARRVAERRQPLDLLVTVRPQNDARELATALRWCRAVHATVELDDLADPVTAEATCHALIDAGLAVRVKIDASRPEPQLAAALHLARRVRAHDIIFPGEGRRLETTRARKRYLQMPWTLLRNAAHATLRRPLWWLDAARMFGPLVSRE